jgi:hypothetical protein
MMQGRKFVVLAFTFLFAVVQASAVLAQDQASASHQREALLGTAECGEGCTRPIEGAMDALNVLPVADPFQVGAHAKAAPQEPAAGEDTTPLDGPQAFVTCTGWHALCSASPDCQMSGGKADCDCMKVNEPHIVLTSEIQDAMVKRLTQATCTDLRPCAVDQAPVCSAMADGRYEVDGVTYGWVSTYSYRGWCALPQGFVACDPQAPGYSGDRSWAVCDAAPCTENLDPSDPNRPLSCRCRVVENEPFVGVNGSCTGEMGGIFSSFPMSAWDFEHDTYPFPVPGYEWVQGACAPLGSDAWEELRSERGEDGTMKPARPYRSELLLPLTSGARAGQDHAAGPPQLMAATWSVACTIGSS